MDDQLEEVNVNTILIALAKIANKGMDIESIKKYMRDLKFHVLEGKGAMGTCRTDIFNNLYTALVDFMPVNNDQVKGELSLVRRYRFKDSGKDMPKEVKLPEDEYPHVGNTDYLVRLVNTAVDNKLDLPDACEFLTERPEPFYVTLGTRSDIRGNLWTDDTYVNLNFRGHLDFETEYSTMVVKLKLRLDNGDGVYTLASKRCNRR